MRTANNGDVPCNDSFLVLLWSTLRRVTYEKDLLNIQPLLSAGGMLNNNHFYLCLLSSSLPCLSPFFDFQLPLLCYFFLVFISLSISFFFLLISFFVLSFLYFPFYFSSASFFLSMLSFPPLAFLFFRLPFYCLISYFLYVFPSLFTYFFLFTFFLFLVRATLPNQHPYTCFAW
jgi:hypothetical protein